MAEKLYCVLRRPLAQGTTSGSRGTEAIVWLTSLFLIVAAHFVECAAAAELSSKLANDGNWVTVPVVWDGERLVFVLDTGSPTSAVDNRFRQFLVPANSEGSHIRLYKPPRMAVVGTHSGNIRFPSNCAIACLDLAPLRIASDIEIAGVIGMDFLGQYALELDFDSERLSIRDAASIARDNYEAAIPIKVYGRRPTIQIRTGDVKYWALIDTGALVTMDLQTGFGENVYEFLLSLGSLREVGSDAFDTLTRAQRGARTGRLRDVNLGPFSHADLCVGQDELGLLGLYYWRRYRCSFDFPGSTVFLNKGRFFDHIDDTDHLGIDLQPGATTAPAMTVSSVNRGSLGERLGIRTGDQLLMIDGQLATSVSITSIYRQLSFRPEREVVVQFQRDNREFRVIVPRTARRQTE